MTSTTIPAPPDIRPSAEIVAAARSLVAARDGLTATLVHLAEHTARETVQAAVGLLRGPLAALPAAEADSYALRLTNLASEAYGTWCEGLPDPDEAADRLRALALECASRVIHVLRVDACLCREVRS